MERAWLDIAEYKTECVERIVPIYYNFKSIGLKEQDTVAQYLNDLGYKFMYNVYVAGFYPDLLFESKTGFTIVEVDERQHNNHNKLDELKRMIDLQAILGKPVIFIRYNPYFGGLPHLRSALNWALNAEGVFTLLVYYMFYDTYDMYGELRSLSPLIYDKLDYRFVSDGMIKYDPIIASRYKFYPFERILK